MLHLLNNQPFISFDHLGIDFDRIFDEAVEFMIRHPQVTLGAPTSSTAPRIDDVKLTEHDLLQLEKFKPLELDKKHSYLKIVKKIPYVWNIFSLNQPHKWENRQNLRKNFFPNTVSVMPYFIEVLHSIKIFSQIGWARIYGNEPYNYVDEHTDWSPNIELDQFIYFNIDTKGLYMRHYDSDEQVYPDKKLIFFDVANIHGTDSVPYYSFSMRVDGLFTKEFMETLHSSRLNKI